MNRFMQIAIDEAIYGFKRKHGGPFGCVIVKNGKIIAKCHNTVLRNHDSTCHAEINAIKDASKKLKTFDLSECVIYSTGKPCPMCRAALNWAKVKNVYYSCTYDIAEVFGFEEENCNNTGYVETLIDQNECSDILLALKKEFPNSLDTKY